MVEAHTMYKNNGFQAVLLGGYSTKSNTYEIIENSIGTERLGGHLDLAYDLMKLAGANTRQKLYLFTRGEYYQIDFDANTSLKETAKKCRRYVFGFTYLPIEKLSLKADYHIYRSEIINDVSQFSLGMGYHF